MKKNLSDQINEEISRQMRESKEGETNITQINAGGVVFCDICNRDYTDSEEGGGFILGTYAYCPVCAGESLGRILGLGEEKYITDWCPKDKSFRQFVLEYRGGDAIVNITTGGPEVGPPGTITMDFGKKNNKKL